MKRSISALAVILGSITAVWAAPPAPLTSIAAIQALTNEEANRNEPVAFDATVTFILASERTLFVQDGSSAIYVFPPEIANFVPGDRVRITGTTRADFSPSVVGNTIVLLHHGRIPRPTLASYDELIRGHRDCVLVTVRAVIRTVDVEMRNDTRYEHAPMHPLARVQLLGDEGYFEALVSGENAGSLSKLLDAEVEVTGIASFNFDGKMHPTGVELNVTSPANVKPIALASADPWSLPPTAMDRILNVYRVRDLTQRVRVHGAITYYQPGTAVVIQDGAKSLWISTMTNSTLHVGDIADAIGFPATDNGRMTLTRAEVRDSQTWSPIAPQASTAKDLMGSGHLFDLVSVEGKVVASVREGAQDEYVLVNDGQIFSAIFRHPEVGISPMKEVPVGSRVQVVGICTQDFSNRFIAMLPFDILLRTPDDISIVANPSLISTRNLLILIALLLSVLFAVGTRAWLIERRVRRETAAMAYIEQRRSLILERINSARPLAETIEEITELVSCKLKGAPSWCQIAGGAQLGNRPSKLEAFRVVEAEIPARSGLALGSIFAALDPLVKPSSVESQAMAKSTALAALAIETHRLYTDLRRRSDFDLLTDTLNRFSLDKRMAELLAEARASASLIGLVYVDLDCFKQINDSYGHQIGDFYLLEASTRMKRQLRNGDTLARIGGDEFAVLLAEVHSRAEVEEIALRLEQCFDEPFEIENTALRGSASVGIALYPEDATDKEQLLRVADTAMYAAKNCKRRIELSL